MTAAKLPTPKQIRRLQAALDARATEKSRNFWSKYLKGDAMFRGVPMGGVREAVHVWWKNESLGELTVATQTKVATEDKLAGVLALSEILLPRRFYERFGFRFVENRRFGDDEAVEP